MLLNVGLNLRKLFFFNDLDGILKRHIEEQETKTGGNPSYDG